MKMRLQLWHNEYCSCSYTVPRSEQNVSGSDVPSSDLLCVAIRYLLSKYVNQNSLKQYYNSYVLPVFDFGCVVWGNTINSNLTRLVKLQKRAARMVLKADFMTPSEQLFKDLNWLPFPKRVQYHTCLMVYESVTGKALQCSRMSRNTMRSKPG